MTNEEANALIERGRIYEESLSELEFGKLFTSFINQASYVEIPGLEQGFYRCHDLSHADSRSLFLMFLGTYYNYNEEK